MLLGCSGGRSETITVIEASAPTTSSSSARLGLETRGCTLHSLHGGGLAQNRLQNVGVQQAFGLRGGLNHLGDAPVSICVSGVHSSKT